MISQERLILMTKMAAYDEHEGRRNMDITSYFRSDYIALNVIRSIAGATLAYAVVFGLYIFYDFELFMQDIYKMDLLEFGKTILKYYIILLVCYIAVSYVIYTVRYIKARKNIKKYQGHLKQLAAMYEIENKKM